MTQLGLVSKENRISIKKSNFDKKIVIRPKIDFDYPLL